MSDVLKILHEGRLVSDNRVRFGDERVRVDVTVPNGAVFSVESLTVTDNFGTATLWSSTGPLAVFTFGVVISNQDLFVQFRNDNGSPKYMILEIKAGIPFYFGSKMGTSSSNIAGGAELLDGTAFDDVNQIIVQRNVADGEGDAAVSLYLFN